MADRGGTGESFGVELTDEEFELFRTILLGETGIVLKESKRQLVKNRLRPLLVERGRRRYAELLDGLATPEERRPILGRIIDAITTNLTQFFREEHQFAILRERCLPEFVRLLERDLIRSVQIWSAGCSSGQEPYSIAMCIRENVPAPLADGFRVVATDIDTTALARARQGCYRERELGGLSSWRRQQHLVRLEDGSFQVSEPLRGMVRFRSLNLSRPQEWGFAAYHVIFCRNVMIYFSDEVRKRVRRAFEGHLQRGGYLFFGHAEGIQATGHTFEYVGPSSYRKGS